MSRESAKDGESNLVMVQESQSSITKMSVKLSNLVKAIKQCQREQKAGNFTDERKIRFLGFLSKLNWEEETSNVETDEWESFFGIMEKILTSVDIE